MIALPPDAKLLRFGAAPRRVVWRPIVHRIRWLVAGLACFVAVVGAPTVWGNPWPWLWGYVVILTVAMAFVEAAFRQERRLAENGNTSLAHVRKIVIRMREGDIVEVPNRLEYSFTDEEGERYSKQTDNLTPALMDLLTLSSHAVIFTLPGWEEKLWSLFRFVDIIED